MKNIKTIKEKVKKRRTFFETLLEKEGTGLFILVAGCLLLFLITDFTLLTAGQIIAAYLILSAVLEMGLLIYNIIYAPIWECKQYLKADFSNNPIFIFNTEFKRCSDWSVNKFGFNVFKDRKTGFIYYSKEPKLLSGKEYFVEELDLPNTYFIMPAKVENKMIKTFK